ncbi:MltA domain-containing protein [Simonsiella muelleri]|uniref:peptidoglycan lytic exotransglycosylase n=1 Tax=Simonsiella muelleri ATCC 29453 TaxID=641147 RepID=V9HL65_9NEIS|nr:MltA domain-containing protein [Simonsiella muelleri]EFG30247.2 hypothetical protein HMPREF9021_01875 [Simonsiella muelleri ATCC 29453]UBQ53012.1 MltA domain-containing protein [Simonsiella muelleri]
MKIKQYALLCAFTCFFAACTNQYPKPTTTSNSNLPMPQPIGDPKPVGFSQQWNDATYTVVPHQQLPNWQMNDFVSSLKAFRIGCKQLRNQAAWLSVCHQANSIPDNPNTAKTFFEQYFTPWQITQNGNAQGLITGYYETVLDGSLKPTAQARFPIYGIPNDFVSIPISAKQRYARTVRVSPTSANKGVINESGAYVADLSTFPLSERTTALKGRFVGNQFVPYYTRNQINGGALNHLAPILGYANDPVELFFLHVQGSGRLKMPNGDYLRLGFADKNDYPYVSIGKYMAERGYLTLAQASAQGIKNYLAQNPDKLAEVMAQNPSYIFFKTHSADVNDGPTGALGVPLMAEFSGAVDKQYIQLGAPLFIATTHPDTQAPLQRLIMAQDTGSAIKGAVRVDYFWGYGTAAGNTAGKMKNQGKVWELLPNGVLPR